MQSHFERLRLMARLRRVKAVRVVCTTMGLPTRVAWVSPHQRMKILAYEWSDGVLEEARNLKSVESEIGL